MLMDSESQKEWNKLGRKHNDFVRPIRVKGVLS